MAFLLVGPPGVETSEPWLTFKTFEEDPENVIVHPHSPARFLAASFFSGEIQKQHVVACQLNVFADGFRDAACWVCYKEKEVDCGAPNICDGCKEHYFDPKFAGIWLINPKYRDFVSLPIGGTMNKK